MNINWSYYWDEIKGRGFYIFGFLGLVFITSMSEWVIIGPFITKSQELGILPNNVGLALFLTKAAVLAIFAVSWDLLSGYSGQISFGHALFLGMGAYISSLVKLGLTLKSFTILGKEFTSLEIFPGYNDDIQEIGGILIDLSVLKAILVASFVIGGFALILGILTLRLKGAYFALVTLVIPLIAQVLVTKIWDDYTGGDGGISLFGRASLVKQTKDENLNFLEKYQRQIEDQYLVVLVLMIISIFLMYMLARSRYGLILKAIREDELAASSSGINVNFYKVSVFTITGFFAGFAGGLFAQISGAATSSMFDAERSFEVIIFTILGGIGTISGGVVGTFMLYLGINLYVSEGFLDIPTIETLSFGLILVLVLKYQPRGIVNAGPKLRNALIFGSFWAVLVTFYDAGEFSVEMLDIFNPSWLLQRLFGEKENGLFGLDVWAVEGLLILYFAIGTVIGYYGPDLMQNIRLKIWGVWPNLGKFDPPK